LLINGLKPSELAPSMLCKLLQGSEGPHLILRAASSALCLATIWGMGRRAAGPLRLRTLTALAPVTLCPVPLCVTQTQQSRLRMRRRLSLKRGGCLLEKPLRDRAIRTRTNDLERPAAVVAVVAWVRTAFWLGCTGTLVRLALCLQQPPYLQSALRAPDLDPSITTQRVKVVPAA
jgi:hypothetical protein